MAVSSAVDFTVIRNSLLREKEHLESETRRLRSQTSERTAINRGIGDAVEDASARADSEVTHARLGLKSTQIGRIKDALARIEAGTYGICSDCEEPIDIVRLKILPFASQCIGCKEKAEELANASRVRRGHANGRYSYR